MSSEKVMELKGLTPFASAASPPALAYWQSTM